MIVLVERLAAAQHDTPLAVLELPYELREKSRLRATLATGEEAALFMPGGTVLRGGDLLRAEDGRVVRVVAAAEPTYRVECHEPIDLARCAFHLGNRHTPIQLLGAAADGHLVLRIRVDPVLKEMLAGLGAHVIEESAPFEPEAGAYAGGHHHHADTDGHHHAPVHAPKIHRAGR